MRRFLATSTFRLSMLYAALFSLSVLALGGFVYWAVDLLVDRQREQTVQAELQGLVGEYRAYGLPGLVRAIESRVAPERVGDGIYLLVDGVGRPMAGNLVGWPTAVEQRGPWLVFPVERRGVDRAEVHVAYGIDFPIAGGFRLLVGQNTQSTARVLDTISDVFLFGVLAMLLLAIGGGLLFSRNLLRRIEAINKGAERVRSGDVAYRMPVGSAGDEFDRLGANLNAMLDEIGRLMNAIRAVTDNIAHDLRSPLTRLRNRLEELGAGHTSSGASRAAIEAAIGEADQVLATFRALLSIADAESGAALAERGRVDLSRVAADAAELYEALAEEQGIAIERAIEPDLFVGGNRQLLFQAIANLLDNALKHGNGPVRLSLSRTGNEVLLSIGDRGAGIPEFERPRVLERFVRLDSSRSTSGTGLGLSLAAAIVRLHGGRLVLDDNRPGLLVSITLPAATGETAGSIARRT
ncbi:MAG: HAMP domain-containing sensor histidine kinase [Rhodospirillaceae bacterium]|nr:HAMP domain-containing sensor histidine kinase [Rhodospirillaceae bacterium]